MKYRKKPIEKTCESCKAKFFITPYRNKIGRGRFCSVTCITYENRVKHGHTKTRAYRIWIDIKSRCFRKTCAAYKLYGAVGITMHPKWLAFEQFYKDMGEPPSTRHQIDRIDNSRGYEPSNCRWVTPAQQARNTSRCKLNMEKAAEIRQLSSNGMTTKDIAERYAVSLDTIWAVTSGRTWRYTYEDVE